MVGVDAPEVIPVGGVGTVADGAPGDGDGLGGGVEAGARPAKEEAARDGKVGEGEGGGLDGIGGRVVGADAIDAVVVGDVIGDYLPVGGVGAVSSGALGDGDGLGGGGEASARPSGEGVALAGGVSEGEFGSLDVVGGRIVGRAATEIVGDGVIVGRPGGGIGAVAVRALGYGDGGGGRIEAGAGPASKVVVFAGGVDEGEIGRFDVVGGGVGGGQVAIGEVVGDVIGDRGPMCGVAEGGVRMVGDGDGGLRRVAVATRPAVEGVALTGGVGEGEGGRLPGVGGGIVGCAAVKVVADGPGIAALEGAEVAVDGATEVIAGEVLDGDVVVDVDVEAGDGEAAAGIFRDGATEGEHVAAAAVKVVEGAPAGAQRERAGDGDNLAESHRDIDVVALAMLARVDGDSRHGGIMGVDGLDVSFDIPGDPLVATHRARSIEAQHQGAETVGDNEATVGGAAAIVELLLREGVFVAISPGVGGTGVVADGGDGESVAPEGSVSGTSIHLEASHI